MVRVAEDDVIKAALRELMRGSGEVRRLARDDFAPLGATQGTKLFKGDPEFVEAGRNLQEEPSDPSRDLIEARIAHEEGIIKMAVLDAYAARSGGHVEKGRHFDIAPVVEKILKRDVVVAYHVIDVPTFSADHLERMQHIRHVLRELMKGNLGDLESVSVDADVEALVRGPVKKLNHAALGPAKRISQMEIRDHDEFFGRNIGDHF